MNKAVEINEIVHEAQPVAKDPADQTSDEQTRLGADQLSAEQLAAQSWNAVFTGLIRHDQPNLWGNWGLASSIKVGTLGRIDDSGNFIAISQLENIDLNVVQPSYKWKVSSKGSKKSETKINLDGKYVDTTTGLEVTVGLETKWEFSESESLVSEMAIQNTTELKNILDVASSRYDELYKIFAAVNGTKESNHGILQGYGFISKVIYAASGLNVASHSKNTSFALTGAGNASHALLGDNGGVTGKGSYLSEKASENVNSLIWPNVPETTSAHPIPIAYEFCSFGDSRVPVPAWSGKIASLQLLVDSVIGCTYTVKCELSYTTSDKQQHVDKFTVIGGQSHNVSLPLDVVDAKLQVKFVGVLSDQKVDVVWHYPIQDWRNGRRKVELHGVWPGAGKVVQIID